MYTCKEKTHIVQKHKICSYVCTGICGNKKHPDNGLYKKSFWRGESAICRKMFHKLWALIDRGWYRLTPAVQHMKITWNASINKECVRWKRINKCQRCWCCVDACSSYHFTHREVEFEGLDLWLASLSRHIKLLSPGFLYRPLTRFIWTSYSIFLQEGWLGAAWCWKACVNVCVTIYWAFRKVQFQSYF